MRWDESVAPLVVWKKELLPDSGGAGRWPRRVRTGHSHRGYVAESLRAVSDLPKGGTSPQRASREAGTEEGPEPRGLRPAHRALPEKGRTVLDPGDVIRLVTAGGGGFGKPVDRDADLVAEDLRDEIISDAAARDVYGLGRRGGS